MAKRVTAVVNQKGGVGKTTACISLAASNSKNKRKTLLVDLTVLKNATDSLIEENKKSATISDVLLDRDIKPANAIVEIDDYLHLLPSHLSLAAAKSAMNNMPGREFFLRIKLINKIAHLYDDIFIDCENNLDILTGTAVEAANLILIPIKYEKYSLQGLKQMFDLIKTMKEISIEKDDYQYKILRNHLDPRESIMQNYIEAELGDLKAQGVVLNTIIPKDANFTNAAAAHLSIFEYAPSSNGANAIRELTKELLND